MPQTRLHSPITANGRHTGGGEIIQAASGNYRRKPKQLHPDCATDTKPHRALTHQWLRDGFTVEDAADFVRTRLSGDAMAERALTIYSKMANVPRGHSPGHYSKVEAEPIIARFPLSTRDLHPQPASNTLVLIGDDDES